MGRLAAIGIGIASILALIVVGRYLLNPLFGLLANAKAREILTAAALLVVLGSALALQLGGLSALWNSAYGNALLRKLAFVAAIAALGAWHWRFAQPALGSERSLRVLRWSIAVDVVFLLAVLALTAILTGTAPPLSVS